MVTLAFSTCYVLYLSNQQKGTTNSEFKFQSTIRKISTSLRTQGSLALGDKHLQLWRTTRSPMEGSFQRSACVDRRPEIPGLDPDIYTGCAEILHQVYLNHGQKIFVSKLIPPVCPRNKVLMFSKSDKCKICTDLR